MSHPKDEAIMVKCLAQGHKRRDWPGRDIHKGRYNIGYVGKTASISIEYALFESRYNVKTCDSFS